MAAWVTPRRKPAERPNRRPLPRLAVDLLGRRARNGTCLSRFGHFRAEVPKSLHIGAYRRALQIAAVRHAAMKPLQVGTFAAGRSRRST